MCFSSLHHQVAGHEGQTRVPSLHIQVENRFSMQPSQAERSVQGNPLPPVADTVQYYSRLLPLSGLRSQSCQEVTR